MRRLVRALLAATAGLLLAAGFAASPAEATARPTLVPAHVHGTETAMPGMDHDVSPMPGMNHEVSPMPGMNHEVSPMPGMDHEVSPMPGMTGSHNDDGGSRPRALVLAGFGGLNGAVLVTAMILRRRTRPRH
jgi:uncharacterized protein involved in copper resistance